jgi:hypothetical protein
MWVCNPSHVKSGVLIGVKTAKDEYDASVKEDEKQSFATGSIFQGLRADLNG